MKYDQHFINFKKIKMADFIPRSDDTLVTWITNYKAKRAYYAKLLGLDVDGDTTIADGCDNLVNSIVGVNDIEKQMNNKVAVKEQLKKDVVGLIRKEAGRVKTEPNFTPAIGYDLDIIGTSDAVDLSLEKPTLSITTNGGAVTVGFKKGKSNGIRLYCQRTGETAPSFLALDTHSPYLDARPNLAVGVPETRQYFAYFINNTDTQVGLQSDMASVTV
jgi:hypothetical protein